MLKSKYLFLAISLVLCSQFSIANEKNVEISFGTSQMLVDEVERAELKNTKKVVLPTTGAVFIAEYLWSEKWGSLFVFNLPLVTQKFIVDGNLIEEAAAETFMLGQRYTPMRWRVTKTAVLSPQVSVLVSTIMGNNIQVSPSFAGRMHITDESGFSMYLG